MKLLNGVVGWHNEQGMTFEVDPKHTEIIINQLELSVVKVVCTLGIKEEGNTTQDAEQELDESQISQHRAMIARCNYIRLTDPIWRTLQQN